MFVLRGEHLVMVYDVYIDVRSTAADPLLEYWNIRKMEYWNIGHHGTKVYWYVGILVYLYIGMVYWYIGILEY